MLFRSLEALIAAGDGEAFMAVAKRIVAEGSRVIKISIEPPLNADELPFDAVSHPRRYRRTWRHGKKGLSLKEEADGRAAD